MVYAGLGLMKTRSVHGLAPLIMYTAVVIRRTRTIGRVKTRFCEARPKYYAGLGRVDPLLYTIYRPGS